MPVLTTGASRTEHLAALLASTAELSSLNRSIHQLRGVLAARATAPALTYRVMLDGLSGDVRRHLMLAACVLADLQPG